MRLFNREDEDHIIALKKLGDGRHTLSLFRIPFKNRVDKAFLKKAILSQPSYMQCVSRKVAYFAYYGESSYKYIDTRKQEILFQQERIDRVIPVHPYPTARSFFTWISDKELFSENWSVCEKAVKEASMNWISYEDALNIGPYEEVEEDLFSSIWPGET